MSYGIRLFHLGDGDVPGPEVYWMSEWDRWITLGFQAFLIEGEGVRALVSTGPSQDISAMNARWATFLGERAALRRDEAQWLPEQLSDQGISLSSITHIILTPLQLYTTSNVPYFPNAQICLSRRGWEHYHSTHDHPHDDRWSSISRDVLEYMTITAWDHVRLLEDEDVVMPGIRTWWAGAHHRASMVVEVDTPGGIATITDSYFVEGNLEGKHPIGICENIYEAGVVYERVNKRADIALTLYDRDQLARFPSGVVVPPPTAG